MIYKIFAPLMRTVLHNSITGKTIKGTTMKLYYDRSQHLGFLFDGQIDYEHEFSAIVLQHIHQGNLIFEIGSNIGQYSLQISAKIGDQGKLICVEPDSDNFAFLSFNTLKNSCSNVELLNLAVADKEGTTTFYKDTVTGGRMGSLIRQYTGNHYQGRSEEVTVTTLQLLMKKFGVPDFVKVDVEGAEDLIFSNATSIHPKTTYLIEVREETKTQVFNQFNAKGFSIYLLEQKMAKMEKVSDIPGFANLLARHE